MKKLATVLALLALLLCLVGCGNGETPPVSNPDGGDTNPPVTGGYVFQYGTQKIQINDDMAGILEALGEPVSYFEAASCAFDGLDKTYTYAGVEIMTWPDGETDRVLSIVFLDDTVETAEGVTVGQSGADIEAAYPDEFKQEGINYVCTRGETQIVFVVEAGKIISIRYVGVEA